MVAKTGDLAPGVGYPFADFDENRVGYIDGAGDVFFAAEYYEDPQGYPRRGIWHGTSQGVEAVVTPGDPFPWLAGDRVFASQPVDPLLFFELGHARDEVAINIVPFVAVFDDGDARERFGDDDWNVDVTRDGELTQYIVQYADRIHFNRYTGVAMR